MTAQTVLPRWRGFNLLEMFTMRSDGNFKEDDFKWISDWGFNFVRIPMCYLLWVEDRDPFKIYEPMLENVDKVVRWGEKYGIHVNLNFHRAPGFSVNREYEEPFNLWKDQEALDAFCLHWQLFARRYKGISSEKLSFNLVNEPMRPSEKMSRADHERVIRTVVKAIRDIDPDRLIIADGLSWANEPLPELADLGIAQSCRAYIPSTISHYKASWMAGSDKWPVPTWPESSNVPDPWNRQRLEEHYGRWAELAKKGVGVHCGEGGAHNFTPHDVVLAWFRDVLEILKSYGIGYALWNFRGSFGILDSGRSDVEYEDWYGHKLDRKYLELLQEY